MKSREQSRQRLEEQELDTDHKQNNPFSEQESTGTNRNAAHLA